MTPDRLTLPQLMALLKAERYTGAVVLHFGQGEPHRVQRLQAEVTIALDRQPPSRADLTR